MKSVKVKSGLLELKQNNPYKRSFKVPPGSHKITQIDVYTNEKNHYFSVVICLANGKNRTRRGLLESDVKEILNKHAKGGE